MGDHELYLPLGLIFVSSPRLCTLQLRILQQVSRYRQVPICGELSIKFPPPLFHKHMITTEPGFWTCGPIRQNSSVSPSHLQSSNFATHTLRVQNLFGIGLDNRQKADRNQSECGQNPLLHFARCRALGDASPNPLWRKEGRLWETICS
jgi:hypothetical protein